MCYKSVHPSVTCTGERVGVYSHMYMGVTRVFCLVLHVRVEGLGFKVMYMGVTSVQPSVTCNGGRVGCKVICTCVLQECLA